MSKNDFWHIIKNVATTREFAKVFNTGVVSLDAEEKNNLINLLTKYGVPLTEKTDCEITKVCGTIVERSIKSIS